MVIGITGDIGSGKSTVIDYIKDNINYVDDFIQEHKNSFTIIESALLLETSLRDICEEIWYIKVSEDERIQRLIMGRNYTYAQAKLFIDNQKNENYFLSNCHVIINNDNLLIMKKSVDEKLKRINIEQKKRFKALFLLTCFLIN